MATRRQFLQVGLAGTAVLAGAGLYMHLRSGKPVASRGLDPENAAMVGAIASVVLAGALPAEAAARREALAEVVAAFDRAVSGLPPAVRGEVAQLLGVLRFAPTRYLLAGLSQPVEKAPPAEIEAFLARWRTSRFDLLRAGYQALSQLVNASWYGNPASWARIGYPGPPRLP